MIRVLVLTIFTLILSQSCITTSEVKVTENKVFPTVTGTNLEGDEKTLPNCLAKNRTIVVVAFERDQQKLCDAWYKQIETHLAKDTDSAYFEIPTISKMNPFTRWIIYRGMRSGIEDEQMRKQVITLHIDKKPFKDSLGIDTEKTVHVFVMDRYGNILEKIKGEFTNDKWKLAEKALTK
ncbi:MAG: hypothetical protein NE334_03655 [Lentisphaeraceae bacterium]|nr:hypothetical protein [Lentisphaeraceae bacterium]